MCGLLFVIWRLNPQETVAVAAAAAVEGEGEGEAAAAAAAAAAVVVAAAGADATRRAQGGEARDTLTAGLHRMGAQRAAVGRTGTAARREEGVGRERTPLPAPRMAPGAGSGGGRRQAEAGGGTRGAALPMGVGAGVRGRRQARNPTRLLNRGRHPRPRIKVRAGAAGCRRAVLEPLKIPRTRPLLLPSRPPLLPRR